MELLRTLCSIFAPSGDEGKMKDFIIQYVEKNSQDWACQPTLIHGEDFQDCLILEFGKPTTAIYAHMDSIGFTVRYEDQLVPIGSPDVNTGDVLIGEDVLGPIECTVEVNKETRQLRYKFGRPIQRGTNLVFKSNFIETETTVQSCYMDNRLGIFNCLKVAETLENGAIVFSCWEEHGGGSVPYLAKYLFDKWEIKKSLISDITWVTDGVFPGKGAVISMRDHNVPRKSFINHIIDIATKHAVTYQLEVEGAGSSDGRELQLSPYPIDWCFIGAPEDHVHSPLEKVHKKDIASMIKLYQLLMKEL